MKTSKKKINRKIKNTCHGIIRYLLELHRFYYPEFCLEYYKATSSTLHIHRHVSFNRTDKFIERKTTKALEFEDEN